tara:strand:+ start:924 stop:1829 length:906 start_codon:yes stop_codon:yes gene_type:complete
LSSVDYENVLGYINNIKWEYFVICIILSFFSNVLRALRWAVLLEDTGYTISRTGLICGTFFGFFINILIPRGGEIARSTSMSYKYGLPANKLLGTILLERLIDFIMLLTLILLVTLINFQLFGCFFLGKLSFLSDMIVSSWKIEGIFFVIGILAIIILFKLKSKFSLITKINNFLFGILDGLKSIKQLKRRGLFIIYTVGIWLFYILITYIPFYAFIDLENLGLVNAMFVLILGGIGMIIPTPGGLGSYHAVVIGGMISVLDVSREVATAYAFTSHTLITLYTLFIGLFCAIFIFKGKRYI